MKWQRPREREHLVELVIAEATKHEAAEGGNWVCGLPAESNLTGSRLCSGGASPLRRLGSRELEGFSPLEVRETNRQFIRGKSKNKKLFIR